MKKTIISLLMVTLILTNTLSIVFTFRPSFAEEVQNVRREDAGFNGLAPSEESDKTSLSDRSDDSSSKTLVTGLAVKHEAVLTSGGQTPSDRGDNWNLNDTSEWSKSAYLDGNKTRLIIGINGEKPNILELERMATKHGAKIVSDFSIRSKVKAVVVELMLTSVTGFLEDVRASGLASYVEPSIRIQAFSVPNDPYWNVQWGLQKIQADWAWNTTVGSSDVLVAVVDTGIDYTHPDLDANYVPLGYDWVNNDTDPMDDHGHGTHCAGIIAAELNNNVGVAGLAQVRVMAEKVLDSGGSGYAEWVANGIKHAVDAGAKIISMSLGSYGDSELIHDAVRYAYDMGVLIIAAAGNDDTNIKSYPAGYEEVVAVAATDQSDNKAYFSNWGDWIELAAPGVDIYSTVPWGYESWSGTSMACPHISGVAALIWSKYPGKSGDWVRLFLRSAVDDLGDPGFDVNFGYGRVNARKAVEQTPPTHELMVYNWNPPPYVRPGTSQQINTTVLNFGETNETYVSVQLLANGTIIDSTVIDSLTSGSSKTVSLSWSPSIVGSYNVTAYVVPVPEETNLENNALCGYIYVGFPVKAVVLHSAGNIESNSIANWQALNNEWHIFGDTMVYIDYTTLNKESITYEDIAATEADVLIISCAYDPSQGWQFTDSEIEAITQYVHEGHGLIATAGTLYLNVPNNNKLAPLFGLNETIMCSATGTDLLHLVNTTHPMFTNVPNPLVFPTVGTNYPSDGRWDSNELAGGKYLALGHYQESMIVAHRGLVYITPWLEIIPPYYQHHLQLLYNAITWSRYEKPQHGLEVSLQCPVHLHPGESVLVNATVANIGINAETNVELLLFSNDSQVASLAIPTLLSGESATLSYPWTPTMGTHNVTAYSPPLPGEDETFDNVKMKYLRVSYAAVIGFVETHGESLHSSDLKTFYENMGHITVTIHSTLTPEVLAGCDILVVGEDWSNYQWTPSEIAAVQEFIGSGKGFVGIGDELAQSVMQILMEYGFGYTGYYGEPGRTSNFDHSHPIMNNVNYIYSSYPADSLRATPPGYWIANDASNVHMLIAGAESGGTVLCMSDDFGYDVYAEDNDIMFANVVDWMAAQYDHDLLVSLDAPAFLEPGHLALLNATVRNKGLNNETDVELQLLVNGTAVNSITIPDLATKQSYTLNYPWTPTLEGAYNITAYAQPVPGGENTANNVASKSVSVRQIKYILFDQTHGTDNIASYSTWVASLTERGYVVETNNAYPITPITLEGHDVLIIPQAYSSYSEDELTTIENFVSSGGGLLVIGDDNPSIYTSLTDFAGITWLAGGTSGITTDITPHFVTTGVTSVYLSAPIAEMNVAGDAQGLVRDVEGSVMLAVSELPYGKVMGFADEDSLINGGINQAYNLLLANNMIDWLTIQIRPEHDIAVTVQAPAATGYGVPTLLNAIVSNRGLSNETNVELSLLIDGTAVKSSAVTEVLVGQSYTLNYSWSPAAFGTYYNITAFAPLVPGENLSLNNQATRIVYVSIYTRTYLSHEWIDGGTPMNWHGDDNCWALTLPFDFPFYSVHYGTVYVSSNGLISLVDFDSSLGNSIPALATKLAIAPAWDDWTTYDPFDIFVWQSPTQVGIMWHVRHYSTGIVADFEAILSSDGVIQFNYESSDGSVSATVGISNGEGDILAEDLTDLSYINTIRFEPIRVVHDVAVVNVEPSVDKAMVGDNVTVAAVVENQGNFTESFTLKAWASPQESITGAGHATSNLTRIYLQPSNNTYGTDTTYLGFRFNVSVWIQGAPIFAGANIYLHFDDDVVHVDRWFLPENDPNFILYGLPIQALPEPPDPGYHHISPGDGSIEVSVTKGGLPPTSPWAHDGIICILEFEVMAIPPPQGNYSTPLIISGDAQGNIDRTFIVDPNADLIPGVVEEDGYYMIVWGSTPPPTPSGALEIGAAEVIGLAPGARMTLNFTWDTTDVLPMDYQIWAEASAVPHEIETADNVYTDGIVKIEKMPVARFTWYPAFPKPGENVVFDASASTPDGGTIVNYYWDFGDMNTATSKDPTMSHVYTGSGLFNVTLTIEDSDGLNASTWQLAYVYIRDVAIIDVSPPANWTYAGRTIIINVTVTNQGEPAETFNVTLYSNITARDIIGVRTVSNLLPGENMALTFTWNTYGVNLGSFNITAIADILPGETDILDNTLSIQIRVNMRGDINGDGKVNLLDYFAVALAFGENQTRPRWNPVADINEDGKINLIDVFMTALNFGKTY